MTGRLGRNLRQGHKAEQMGVKLLRPFCAVADVPQTEDVGFDAVATLLRQEGRFFYAEESFCVQFKARSVREIAYEPHEFKWLRALNMPFLIGSVDLEDSSVALYTTHSLATRIDGESFKSGVLHLDPNTTRFDDDVVHQYLGPPILQWSIVDCEDGTFQTLAYDVLKKWMLFEYVNLRLRAIRSKRDVRWKTNEVPTSGWTSMMGHPSELDEDLSAASPYLSKLALHLFSRDDDEVPLEALGLYLLARWLREKGVSESDVVVKMMEAKMIHRFNKLDLQLQVEKS